jgi:hypothetical protein
MGGPFSRHGHDKWSQKFNGSSLKGRQILEDRKIILKAPTTEGVDLIKLFQERVLVVFSCCYLTSTADKMYKILDQWMEG